MQHDSSARSTSEVRDIDGLFGSPYYRAAAVDYFHRGCAEATQISTKMPSGVAVAFVVFAALILAAGIFLCCPQTRVIHGTLKRQAVYSSPASSTLPLYSAVVITDDSHIAALNNAEEVMILYRGYLSPSHVYQAQIEGKTVWRLNPTPEIGSPSAPITIYLKTSLIKLALHNK